MRNESEKNLNGIILDGITWSYSSVNLYNTCPGAFKFVYLDICEKTSNAFAEYGTFMHSLFERYFRGELEFFELSDAYEKGYENAVKTPFPYNRYADLDEKYYQSGLDYLNGFDGLYNLYNYEVVDVERRFQAAFRTRDKEYLFTGVIDLVLKDGDGGYVILDHKSKSKFANRKELAEYARQLYLYAVYIESKYGVSPKKLVFHMFRNGGELVEIPYSLTDAKNAVAWFTQTVEKIYRDQSFQPVQEKYDKSLMELKEKFQNGAIGFSEYVERKKEITAERNKMSYFCQEICSARGVCPYGGHEDEAD